MSGGFVGQGRGEVLDPTELISVDAYRAELLAQVTPLEPIELSLADALDRVLAEDVVAREALPAFANAAMDGYAVVAADTASATVDAPVALQVTGEVRAGRPPLPPVVSGTAVRIMTGAAVPPGADAVVPVEVTREEGGTVWVHRPASAGDNVRRVGEDITPGTTVLRAGTRVGPSEVAVLAALGQARVRCHPTPRVVVLSTGDELVPPDRVPAVGQLRDSNGPMLAALVRRAGAVPFSAGIVPDDRRALADAFETNLGHADLFLVSGGASRGVSDLVAEVVDSLGHATSRRVAMRPGMPQVAGEVRGVPVIGVPGNPVSAFVSFEVFVRPIIRRLQGRDDLDRPRIVARLEEPVRSSAHRRTYVRVRLRPGPDGWLARPTGAQGSHLISSLLGADGLAEIPEEVTVAEAGTTVTVHLLVDL